MRIPHVRAEPLKGSYDSDCRARRASRRSAAVLLSEGAHTLARFAPRVARPTTVCGERRSHGAPQII
eukprot:5006624-Pyramimonas_sp.AAC.1